MKNTLNWWLLSCISIVSLSCGDLYKSKVVENPIESTRFSAKCDLDIEEFENIFSKNISYQIDCLGKNLDLFIRVVESGKPGYLSRVALEQYLTRNVTDFNPENLKAVKSVFKISHLLFGSDPNYLSPQNVKKIIDFLFLFNREVVKVYPFFSNDDDISDVLHRQHRQRVFSTADTIANAMLDIFEPSRGGQVHSLNIIELLESITYESNSELIQKAKALLFVKKLILGGEPEVLTHREVQDFLYKSPSFANIGFDLIRSGKVDFSQSGLIEFLKSDVGLLENILFYPKSSLEPLFTLEDITSVLKIFAPDFHDLSKYIPMLTQFKMTLTTDEVWSKDEDLTGKNVFYAGEIDYLLKQFKSLLDRGDIYLRLYDFLSPQLSSPLHLSLDYKEYVLIFPENEEFVKDFIRIVNNYRFFKGGNSSPFIGVDYRRNLNGALEIGLLEYLGNRIAKRYGEPNKSMFGHGLDTDNFTNFMVQLGPLVDDLGYILEERVPKVSETMTLLATLFQYQSNGDGWIDVNELAEFAVLLLTGLNSADIIFDDLKTRCGVNKKERISDVACFRENFFQTMCLNYREYSPRLFEYLGLDENCSRVHDEAYVAEFFDTTEKLSRLCINYEDGSEVPVSEGDIYVMYQALLNIEITLTRWDTNKNNVMDPDEVIRSYSVYESAVRALVRGESPMLERFSRQIFQYMIKYRKPPSVENFRSIWHFIRFLVRFNKKSSGDRQTIAAILKAIGEGSSIPDPFDCETLRD